MNLEDDTERRIRIIFLYELIVVDFKHNKEIYKQSQTKTKSKKSFL